MLCLFLSREQIFLKHILLVCLKIVVVYSVFCKGIGWLLQRCIPEHSIPFYQGNFIESLHTAVKIITFFISFRPFVCKISYFWNIIKWFAIYILRQQRSSYISLKKILLHLEFIGYCVTKNVLCWTSNCFHALVFWQFRTWM